MLLPFIITAIIAGNLIGFAVAIRRHFARPEGMTDGTRFITMLGVPLGLLQVGTHWVTAPPFTWRTATGLVLCMTSTLLFAAALRANRARPLSLAGSQDVPQHLNQSGPYARIRHPFYASYLTTWTGSAIMGPWWLWAAPVIMATLYWRHARAEEAKFLSSPLADDYRAYMRRAGLFWPRLTLFSHPSD